MKELTVADDPNPSGAGTPPPAADPPPPPADGAPPPAAAPESTPPTPTDEGKDAAAPPPAKAPDKYDFKVPAEAVAFIDPSQLEALGAIAKRYELTQEDAQAMLEEHAAERVAAHKAIEAQTLADPTYGGPKLSETQQLARRAIERVRPPGHARTEAFNALLTKTGYGNHIEVVSFLADLGKLMAEDTPGSRIPGAPPRTAEEVFYGTPPEKPPPS